MSCQRTKIVAVICGVLLLTLLLLLGAAPYGIKAGLERRLQAAGVGKVEIGDVDFNPFTASLAVKVVRLNGSEGVGLSAATMRLTFDWWPLFQGRLQLKDIEIRDGVITLHHLATGQWQLAGVALAAFGEASEEAGASDSAWQWGVEDIAVTNMAIRYHGPTWQDEFILVSARLAHLASWERDSAGLFSLALRRGEEGEVHLAGEIKPFAAEITGQGTCRVENVPLAMLAPLLAAQGVEGLRGMIGAELTITASQGSPAISAPDADAVPAAPGRHPFSVSVQGTLTGSALHFDLDGAGYGVEAAGFSLTVDSEISRADIDPQGIIGRYQGKAAVDGLRIQELDMGLDLLRAARVNLDGLQGENGQLSLAVAQVDGLELLQRQSPSRPDQDFVVAMGGLAVEELTLSAQGLVTVEALRLADAEVLLVRNDQGEMEFAPWLPVRPGTEQESADALEETGGFVCRRILLRGKNRLVFEDYTIPTPFIGEFSSLVLTAGLLDSRTPHHQTPLTLTGKVGKYADLELTGTISPFVDRTTLDLKGRLASLDLPTLNPYANHFLDYQLESGHLDADIVLRAEAGLLDSEIVLLVEKFEIKRLKDGQQDRFEQITGLPFQYTVDLLRDRKDNIRFRLPIKGEISNPDFNWNNVLTRATAGAVRQAAFSYFTPIGVTLLTGVSLPVGTIYVAGKIFDWAVTMRFQPIVFAPASADLSAEGQAVLDTMVVLFNDRPKVRVVLSGMATLADLGGDSAAAAASGTERALSSADREQLRALAAARALQVKEYLVNQGIEARRLLISEPKIDVQGNDTPRVEIGI